MNGNPVVKAVERELKHYPGVRMELDNSRGRHSRILFERNGHSRFLTVPQSPSDWRAPKNALRDFRKTMEELGASRLEGTPDLPKRSRKRAKLAAFGLTDSMVALHIPSTSKLISKFRTPEGRPAAFWRFELRSSPDLNAPPFLALTKTERPAGKKVVQGISGGFAPGPGAWRITLSRSNFPALASVAAMRSVPVKLYSETASALPSYHSPHINCMQ